MLRSRHLLRRIVSRAARDTVFRRMDDQAARDLLGRTLDVLDSLGIRAWLTDGTLLGCIREGGFIGHDLDIDLGILASDLSPALVPALQRAGLEIYERYGTPRDGYELTLRSRYLYLPGTSLDLFFFYEQGDTVWHAAYWRGHQLRYRYPRFSLERRRFMGRDVWVPSPPEDFLAAKYGPGWRTPDPRWHGMLAPHSLDLDTASEAVRKAAAPWH
ncbi:MAG: LicD family protein [Myxococcales bacterium]|nr:LicD family protein [Myxococcales bacterium]